MRAYDPEAMARLQAAASPTVVYCDDAYEAAEGADALVIATEWNQFRALDLDRLRKLLRAAADRSTCATSTSRSEMAAAGFRYVSIGRPEARRPRRRPSRPTCRSAVMSESLITGGAGFLGSHLCERLLAEGTRSSASTTCSPAAWRTSQHLLDRDDFTLPASTTSRKPFEVEGPVDYVLHFASPACPIDYLELPIQTLKVGSLGTHNTPRPGQGQEGAASSSPRPPRSTAIPLVHPQTETYWGNVNPVGPRGVYDEAKRFAEAMTMAYHRFHGVDTRIVRIFNTYGPRMRPRDGRVVPAFIQQALRGEPMTVFGDGSQTRSFCFVDDLVEGI